MQRMALLGGLIHIDEAIRSHHWHVGGGGCVHQTFNPTGMH